jgi:DNA repair exonuclease SbcCD nuclease subunit
MTTTRYFGDVHGRWETFKTQMKDPRYSRGIQVGDLGIGFNERLDYRDNLLETMSAHNVKFIRGNHDNPGHCSRYCSDRHIEDGHYDSETETFFLGGAWSIDFAYRTPYVNWWPEEECSAASMLSFVEAYAESKPKIVVTHDGPPVATLPMFLNSDKSKLFPNNTIAFLELMFNLWEPELWVFGHWHRTRELTVGRTRFLCVGQNTYVDI